MNEVGRGVRQFRRFVDRPVELTRNFPDSEGRGECSRDSLGGIEEEKGKVGMGVGVVDLQAGGWSFTARDMDGGIWVWGE